MLLRNPNTLDDLVALPDLPEYTAGLDTGAYAALEDLAAVMGDGSLNIFATLPDFPNPKIGRRLVGGCVWMYSLEVGVAVLPGAGGALNRTEGAFEGTIGFGKNPSDEGSILGDIVTSEVLVLFEPPFMTFPDDKSVGP